MELTSSGLVLMSVLLLCSGRLNVRPDRSWFFRYDHVTFSCSHPTHARAGAGQAGQWSVKRNTSTRFSDSCELGWGSANGTSCTIEGLYNADSALYWCETELEQRSSVVNITVTSQPVILSAPVHPVLQGAPFSLLCLSKGSTHTDHSVEFEASFFKDGIFIGNWSPANMSVPAATLSDHGLYSCEHPTRGRSGEVLLTVSERSVTSWINEATSPPPPEPEPKEIPLYRTLCFVFLFLLYTAILCIGICIHRKWARARAEEKKQDLERVSRRRI